MYLTPVKEGWKSLTIRQATFESVKELYLTKDSTSFEELIESLVEEVHKHRNRESFQMIGLSREEIYQRKAAGLVIGPG